MHEHSFSAQKQLDVFEFGYASFAASIVSYFFREINSIFRLEKAFHICEKLCIDVFTDIAACCFFSVSAYPLFTLIFNSALLVGAFADSEDGTGQIRIKKQGFALLFLDFACNPGENMLYCSRVTILERNYFRDD